MKTYCEECGENFNLDELSLKVSKVENDIVHHYLECPNCKERYTSHYSNDEMRNIQLDIQLLLSREQLNVKDKNKLNGLRQNLFYMGNQLKEKIEGKEN